MEISMKDYLSIGERGSDIKTEVTAGITTFLAALYIISCFAGLKKETRALLARALFRF